MSRWEPNARGRLERAALELFVEQGFAETTVPQITARAGLTTRTFFRHFADKREVLFGYEAELPGVVAALMAEAPASLDPMSLLERGLDTVVTTRFAGTLEYLTVKRAVVESDEGLRERELRKQSILSDAISAGFRERGVDPLTAMLAAQLSVSVLFVAVDAWIDQNGERSLHDLLHDSFAAVHAVVGSAGSSTVEPARAIAADGELDR